MEKNTDKTRGYKVQPSFKLGTYRALKQEAENEGRSLANMVERLYAFKGFIISFAVWLNTFCIIYSLAN